MHTTKAPIRNRLDALGRSFRAGWPLLLMAFLIHEAGCNRASQSALQDRLRGIAGTQGLPRFVLRGEAETAPWKETQVFYRQRNFQPAWIQNYWSGRKSVRSQATAFIRCIRDAGQEGLDPGEYSADELEQQIRRVQKSTTTSELAWLDAELTYTFFRVCGPSLSRTAQSKENQPSVAPYP